YWYFWVIVVGFEAVAGAQVLRYWFDAPLWLLSLILMALMTATNLFSVSSFGEFEFWFAGIKVAAIMVFIVLGGLFAFGLWPNTSMNFTNLTAYGGFFPNGVGTIFSAIVVVIFSMVGAEVATIAAAESPNPEQAITKATNAVIMRVGLFFVGAVFLLAVIVPWNSTELGASPFVSAFTTMGIPYADQIMNAVVITAVLSCLNSGLYTASRMIFVLAARREAPMALIRVNKRGVPMGAILLSSVVGFLCVIASAVSPDRVFLFLLNSSGAIILFVYLLISISQFVLRRRTSPEKLRVKMWFFPVLTIATIVAIVAVLLQMLFEPEVRSQFLLSLLSWAIVVALYFLVARRRKPETEAVPAPTGEAKRVLVLANETLPADELMEELRQIDRTGEATYRLCVPANPIDTGQAMHKGAVYLWESTARAAQERLDYMLSAMKAEGLTVDGELGDYRPLRALADAVGSFNPDQIVVATLPIEESQWLRFDVVDSARSSYDIPVNHVVTRPKAELPGG
ncbi:MAG: amino acid permease, partial [Microlunatus sp.]|nr:amino acid permease [Microlunatus sp.]